VRNYLRLALQGRYRPPIVQGPASQSSALEVKPELIGASRFDTRLLPQADVLLVGHHKLARPVVIDGRRIDALFDPLIEAMPDNFAWGKIVYSPGKHLPIFRTKPQWKTALLSMWVMAGPQAREPNTIGSVRGWSNLQAFLGRYRSGLGALLHENRVVLDGMAIERLAAVWGEILDRARPRLVMTTGQTIHTHSLALACHRRKISCADVQHGAGATNETNIKSYGFRQIPHGGYELLPNYFLVWGEAARRRINASLAGDVGHHQSVLLGNPWLYYARSKWGSHTPIRRGTRTILVTLTWLSLDAIPQHVVEVIRSSPGSWQWLVRLHPTDANKKQKVDEIAALFASCDNVDVAQASTTPIFALLSAATHHVSMYSSSCVEASAVGLGTIFTSSKAVGFFGDLLGLPGFKLALDAPTLRAALEAEPERPEPLMISDPAIARAALSNILGARPRLTEIFPFVRDNFG
jgi:hypothetical protein